MSTELDRILSPGYLTDLEARSTDEIRSMRASCQRIEGELSYVRRLAQGRLDIVASEADRRRTGGQPGDMETMLEELPRVLADRTRGPGTGRPPQAMAPDDVDGALSQELDGIVTPTLLASLPEQDLERLVSLAEELKTFEQRVSADRRLLHERIDALQAELTRRYRSGEASVESLLQ